MIKSKSGHSLKIIKGDKKCIQGRKAFKVEAFYSQEDIFKKILNPSHNLGTMGSFYLRRDEMIIDNEDELYEAIGLKRDN